LCQKILPQRISTSYFKRDLKWYFILPPPTRGYQSLLLPWYTKVIEKRNIVWTDPYIFYTSQKPGVTIAAPSWDKDGNLKGIVGVDVAISELSTFISKLKVGKTGQAFMLNQNGDVIAYKNLNNLIIHKKDSSSFRLPKVSEINNDIVFNAFNSVHWQYNDDGFLKLDKPIFSSFLLKNKKFSCMFAPFPDKRLPWVVGVYVPEDDYLAEIKENRTFNIIATVVISLLASFLGLILAKRIIRPIINLQKEAKAIKNNDLSTSFKTSSNFNEIQETANTFASMKKAIINYEDTLVEKEEIYRAITNTANDAIVMMNDKYLISYWNPAAEQMFGYASSEVIGETLHQTIAPSRLFAKYIKGLHHFDLEERNQFMGKTIEVAAINKDGLEFPIEISLSTMKINGKQHALAIIRDITARAQNDQIKKQLARDLHDGIGGNLTNIKLLANILESKKDQHIINDGLHTIADLSIDCISETRNYMNVLEDRNLNWKDFIDELREYTFRVVEPHKITPAVSSEISDNVPPPNTFLYMNLFKMVKEAVNNSIKHAHAANLWVKFEMSEENFVCIVRDNGSGMSPKAGSGRGLLSMESRAAELGGTLKLADENGVTVTIAVPILSANKSLLRGDTIPKSN